MYRLIIYIRRDFTCNIFNVFHSLLWNYASLLDHTEHPPPPLAPAQQQGGTIDYYNLIIQCKVIKNEYTPIFIEVWYN